MSDKKTDDTGIVIEKVQVSGMQIAKFLNPKFLDELKKEDATLTPIFLAIFSQKEKDIIAFSHQGTAEAESQEVHIEARAHDLLTKIISAIERFKKVD